MDNRFVPALLAGIVLAALALAGCSDSSDATAPVIEPAIERNLPTTVEQDARLPDYNIYRPRDLAATGSPLPVIVWTNGGCVLYDAIWSIVLQRWAAAGFVALAPTVPVNGDDPTRNITGVEDQVEAIDWIVAEHERAGSPYRGRFDLDRIVAAGNSCGGIVSLALASMDDRVKSVFVLSGSSGFTPETAAAVMGNILVPVGYIVGGPEDIANGFARQDLEYLPAGVAGYFVERFEGDHFLVSTDPDILADVAEISTNWIDFTLSGNPRVQQTLLEHPCDGCEPGTWLIESRDLDLYTPQQ